MIHIDKFNRDKYSDKKLVEVDCGLVHETEKAYLLNNGKREEWFPKSLVEYDRKDQIAVIPERMAIERGFI